jgi:hypothetical protein
MKKIGTAFMIAAVMSITSMTPAHAITSAQRVQILKYQKCLAQQNWFPWIVCIPPTFP